MGEPKLYRRRFIPDELVYLKNDEITMMNEDVIVTKWTALKPRQDFERGVSCFYLKKGFKISKFINCHGECIYIYCDIIETQYDPLLNAYTFHDLLVDVIVYKNGFVRVLDLDEISDALDQNKITIEQAKTALRLLDKLLTIIYNGQLDEYTRYL